ncbi:SNR25 protein, partial [Thinocorus orbignyianus]|nr:SNR25 protein [Thinocorus orbignyianus]
LPLPPSPWHLPRHVAHVGAGGAGEAVAARPLLGHQHVAAGRAEEQHRRAPPARPPLPAQRWRPGRRPRGSSLTPRLRGADGAPPPSPAAVVVVQNASVLELKKALRRHVQLRQARQGGVQHLSWKYIWRTYHLTYGGEKLADDRKKLRE